MNLTFLFNSRKESDYLVEIEKLSTPSNSHSNADQRIGEIFSDHSDHLIADLIENSTHSLRYKKIGANLKERDSLNSFQSSIDFVQKIAKALRNQDIINLEEACDQLCKDHSLNIHLDPILQNFSSLKLPQNLAEIRAISNATIRKHVMAAIINRDFVEIDDLHFTKGELKSIGPHLTFLSCTRNSIFWAWNTDEVHEFLETCINIKRLVICTEKIMRIPRLPLCEWLDCSSCPRLTHLSELPLCETLYCENCPNLIEISNNLSRCTTLYCHSCIKLTQLPGLPLCKTLNCSNCQRLTRLPELPFCTKLVCNYCTKLTGLPHLPSCVSLEYRECSALDLNSVSRRFRADHRSLQQTLTVRWKDIHEDPFGVLLSLERALNESGRMPRIQFLEDKNRHAEGEDMGGVFRVFIDRLMGVLISSSESQKQLKFHQTDSGLHLPVLDPTRDVENQIEGFKVLGELFLHCYKSTDSESVTLGRLFDRKLFDIIASFTFAELNQIDLSIKLPPEVQLKLMTLFGGESLQKTIAFLRISPQNMTSKQFETLREIVKNNLGEEEKGPPGIHKTDLSDDERIELIQFLQASLRESLLEQMNAVNDWFPATVIAKQMKNRMSLETWENLRLQGVSLLDNKIQGMIDKASLLSAGSNSIVEWNHGSRNLDAVKVEKTKGYVAAWIEKATPRDLERLSRFITGSSTLSPHKKLIFQLYDRDAKSLPTTHTCSFTIDLSINYESQEIFNQKLERALDEVNSNETSGLEFI